MRALYFLFVGWWLGGLAITLAWLCCVLIVLLPIGLAIINRLPSIMTLRPQSNWRVQDGVLVRGKEQRSFLIRAIYFVLIGWWLSAAWLYVAYLLMIIVIGIPIAFWMFGRAGAVTTLYRS